MREPEITSRICRDHLKELLDIEAPAPRQRTTARMPAQTLTGLLCLRDEDLQTTPSPLPKLRVRPRGTDRAVDRNVDTLAVRPLTPPPDHMMSIVSFRVPRTRWMPRLIASVRSPPRPVVIALTASATLVIARLVRLL